MYRKHRITRRTLSKYPPNSIWVDVWHDYDNRFLISLKSSIERYRCYWCDRGIKEIGFLYAKDFDDMLETCKNLIQELRLKVEDFDFHGSSLGNSEFLREHLLNKIKESEK
jgi:hypothetical protein